MKEKKPLLLEKLSCFIQLSDYDQLHFLFEEEDFSYILLKYDFQLFELLFFHNIQYKIIKI